MRARAELAVAVVVLAIAAVVLWQTMAIPSTPLYARIGPKSFPFGVAAMLAVLGLLLAGHALRGGWPNEWRERDWLIDVRALGWVAAGLALNVALIQPLGFVIAATLLFVCVARAFGSSRPLRDAAIAFVFALLVYLAFDRGLGIQIGAGVFEGVL